jgi:hypothetical protein
MKGRHAFEWKIKIVYVVILGPGKLMVLASGSWGQSHFAARTRGRKPT